MDQVTETGQHVEATDPETKKPIRRKPPIRARWMLVAIRLLSVLAMLVSGYLVLVSLNISSISGCGGAGIVDCQDVLTTRWSTWLGIPVSLFAIPVYAAIFLLSFRLESGRAPREAFRTAGFTAGIAAFWFLYLQIFLIQGFCRWCSVVHLCGMLVFGLVCAFTLANSRRRGNKRWTWLYVPSVGALVGLILLILGQAISKPQDVQFVETGNQGPAPDTSAARDPDNPNIISVWRDSVSVNMDHFPVLGDRDASEVFVKLYDYGCPDCRRLHWQLKTFRSGFPEPTAVVLVPVPMNAGCNWTIERTGHHHLDSCVHSRLALAVWLADPDAFSAFHDWMMQGERPPAAADALAWVRDELGIADIEQRVSDLQVNRMLNRVIRLYVDCEVGVVPKLFVRDKIIVGAYEDDAKMLKALEQFTSVPKATE